MANYTMFALAIVAVLIGFADDIVDRFATTDAAHDAATTYKEAWVDAVHVGATASNSSQDASDGKAHVVHANAVADASGVVSGALSSAMVETGPERHRACVADAVAHLLLLEHERRPVDLIQPYVDAAFDSGEAHGVDPLLLVAVGYRESRFRRILGDDGRSCGPWQYQARYHPDVLDDGADRDETCDRLIHDPGFGADAAAERLARFDHVCHYNQGNRCLQRDLDGEANSYSGRVAATRAVIAERCGAFVR